MIDNKEDNIEYDDVPIEFCDPILMAIIENPIMIPEMNIIVEETVIKRHLLSSEKLLIEIN